MSLLCMESRGPTRHLSPLPSPGPCFLVLSQHLGWLGDISFPPERFEIIIVSVLEDVPCFLLLQLSLKFPSTKRFLVRMGYRWVFLSSLWAAIQLPCGDWGQSHQPIQQPRPCRFRGQSALVERDCCLEEAAPLGQQSPVSQHEKQKLLRNHWHDGNRGCARLTPRLPCRGRKGSLRGASSWQAFPPSTRRAPSG